MWVCDAKSEAEVARGRGESRYIQPGKPIQNALVESFNGKFRDAGLNVHWFVDLADARRSIEVWRMHYKRVRPHSALGSVSPGQFRLAGETGCGKAGRCATLENSPNFPHSPAPTTVTFQQILTFEMDLNLGEGQEGPRWP